MTDKRELGIITKATLGFSDNAELGFSLDLDLDNGKTQSFGLYGLDPDYIFTVLCQILRAVGVNDWSELEGQVVWAYSNEGLIYAIEAPAFVKHFGRIDMRDYQR